MTNIRFLPVYMKQGWKEKCSKPEKKKNGDFPGGLAVKNLPTNTGNMGLISVPERSHMWWSN